MMDKKVKEITELQKELDRRTAVEKLAEKLIMESLRKRKNFLTHWMMIRLKS